MLTCIAIAAAVTITFPAAFYLARWIDGDAGYIIRRARELSSQGIPYEQAENMARRELWGR